MSNNTRIKDENFISIQGWMRTVLDLKSTELMSFALIYGFSQDGESEFKGSLNYVCEWLGCTRPTARKALSDLCEKDLIIKREQTENNVTFNRYAVNLQGVKKLYSLHKESLQVGGKETLSHGGKESLLNNIPLKDSIETIGEKDEHSLSLFDDEISKINSQKNQKWTYEKTKVQFKDSKFYDEHIWRRAMKQQQESDEKFSFLGLVDVEYYHGALDRWSDSSGAKKKDWIATALNFMAGDIKKNDLKTLNGNQNDTTDNQKRNGTQNSGNLSGFNVSGLFS